MNLGTLVWGVGNLTARLNTHVTLLFNICNFFKFCHYRIFLFYLFKILKSETLVVYLEFAALLSGLCHIILVFEHLVQQ